MKDSVLGYLADEIERPSSTSWRTQLRLVQALRAALDEWQLAVLMAARSGVDAASWTEIGEAFGTTRQSAWQRLADDVDRPSSAQHRLLKARIAALIAEIDAEAAELEVAGLGEDVPEDAAGFGKRFRALVNGHAKDCRLAEYEDVV